jgi:hypothetical protein
MFWMLYLHKSFILYKPLKKESREEKGRLFGSKIVLNKEGLLTGILVSSVKWEEDMFFKMEIKVDECIYIYVF